VPCSTPFGITEFGTYQVFVGGETPASAQRLSASLNSAHHLPPQKPIATYCAQRLSASLNSAQPGRRRNGGGRRGAQRLSASLNSAPAGGGCDSIRVWCSTPFGITEFGTPCGWARPRGVLRCSTPFGITEFGTGRSR